jgi:hypothetical protein
MSMQALVYVKYSFHVMKFKKEKKVPLEKEWSAINFLVYFIFQL